MPDYDLVIVGGGAAGSEAAFSVADRGRHRILLVESSHFGGTCTNHGCVPTKALVRAARVAHTIRTADRYGIRAAEPVIDWPAVIGRADEVRDHMLRHGAEPFREAGVEVRYPARAVLIGERLLDIDGKRVEAGAVLLAAGLMPALPPVPGLREAGYLDNEAALELKELPERLVVLGCGPIGTEFAQLFSRLGVRVVIVEALDRMLPPEEPETGQALGDVFSEEGIELRLSARVEAVERTGSGRRRRLAGGEVLETDEILVAVGRSLDGEGLGLSRAGIDWTPKGISVDQQLRTSRPWAWAAGDVVGRLGDGRGGRPQRTAGDRGDLGTCASSPGSRSPTPRSPRSASPRHRPGSRATRSESASPDSQRPRRRGSTARRTATSRWS